ncbi:MAG: hypothetical protein KY397_01720, partial [Gemmatimonadetes bacterium]|nr:hypothetical protein [Gemmatimonadota bacterium]
EGARLFRLALDVGAGELADNDRGPLLVELGRALELTGDVMGALDACRGAATIAQETGAPELAAQAALVDVITASADDQYIRDAAISGMKDRELAFLQRLLNDPRWSEKQEGRDVMLAVLTRCVIAGRDPSPVQSIDTLKAELGRDGPSAHPRSPGAVGEPEIESESP